MKQRQESQKQLEFETGNPPSANERIIRTELKKYCLAFIRNEHVGVLNTVHTPDDATIPPQFDIEDAKADGALIRFFEHAFEWDQLQYVFYPYFWARPGGWADRFHARSTSFDRHLSLRITSLCREAQPSFGSPAAASSATRRRVAASSAVGLLLGLRPRRPTFA